MFTLSLLFGLTVSQTATAQNKPKIAVFSGGTATVHNTIPLVTSNKARAARGLPLRTNSDGNPIAFDHLVPQRLAAPVEVLIEQFKDLKCMVDFDRKEAMRQWERLKFELPKHAFFRHTSFVGFWEHVAMHFDTGALTGYSEFIKLALAVLLIVTDTSCCERAYSLMDRIHTYLRNRLEVKTLNDLMCICSNGPELEDFDLMPTLKAWLQLEKRGRNTSIIQRSASSSSSSSIGASGQTSD